jgi:predicted MFS family arabinose efflux permease
VRPKLDLPGVASATAGLFALVYGFSNAETHSWGSPATLGPIAVSAVLLSTFVFMQLRGRHPLLPLRVVLDRDRGGSFLAIGIVGSGMFGVFLFLTYYLQRTLGFSPLQTGLAFLPMMATIVSSATLMSTIVLPRMGPRPLIPTGMVLAGIAMLLLTRVGVHTSYATHVLPGLMVIGLGLGMVFAPAMATATGDVRPEDAGVASAMVNTMQQVGGSIGVALLSTLSASAATGFVTSHGGPAASTLAAAAVHGYTTAFWCTAGIFFLGAILTSVLLRSGAQEQDPAAVPMPAH